MKAFLFPRLRQAPWLYGIAGGIPLLILLRIANAVIWPALFAPAQSRGLPASFWSGYAVTLVLRSLFIGAILGGLSVNMLVEWWEKDLKALRALTRNSAWVTLLLIAWSAFQLMFLFQFVSGSPSGMAANILGSQVIAWQVRLGIVSLINNVPLLWAIALVVTGILLSRRLAYEEKRERQFEPPLSP